MLKLTLQEKQHSANYFCAGVKKPAEAGCVGGVGLLPFACRGEHIQHGGVAHVVAQGGIN
jgi:hypothetical protein